MNKTIICPYCDYEFSAEDSRSLFNDFCNQNQPYQAKIFCENEWCKREFEAHLKYIPYYLVKESKDL